MNEELVERGLELYRTAVRALHELGMPAWLEGELTVAQLKALFALVDGGPMPIGAVASRLSIGLPAASSLVDRLADAGPGGPHQDRLRRPGPRARPRPRS